MTKDLTCIYCKSININKIFGFSYVCSNCYSFSSLVDEIEYKETYHAYRFSWLRPKIYFLLLKAFRCGLKRNIKICDIGCGNGHALFWANLFNCETVGWDISKNLIPPKHKGYDSLKVLSQKEEESCDVVWCWHTIEHSNNPFEILLTAYKILKPGGIFYIEYPEATKLILNDDFESLASFGEHRGIPSKTIIESQCSSLGFTLIKHEKPKEGRWMYLYLGDNFHVRSVFRK